MMIPGYFLKIFFNWKYIKIFFNKILYYIYIDTYTSKQSNQKVYKKLI